MVLESMKNKLAPIHIYDVSGTAINAELRAYADELELLYSELDRMLRERFIETASDEGLREYEELFGPERSGDSVAARRERLRKRLSLGGGDFTPAGIRKALDSFGLEYVISEYPELYRLDILAQTEYSKAEQAFIKHEAEKIVPAHLVFQLLFNTRTWQKWDVLNKSFGSLDQDNLTWTQIDALE